MSSQELTQEQKKEIREIQHKEKKWRRVGGIVYDVAVFLESVARIGDLGHHEYDAKQLATIKRYGTLVASHALQPVIETLDDEQTYWMLRDPERLAE